MTTTAQAPVDIDNQLGLIFQYTVEAYKTFQKLAENLPNPITANIFRNFAEDERDNKDLLEIKYLQTGVSKMKITLGNDLRFQDAIEGDLSYREMAEVLISRERTMEKRLRDSAKNSGPGDQNILIYLAGSKRAHVVLLERELEMIRLYPDWFKREDAESLIVNGFGN